MLMAYNHRVYMREWRKKNPEKHREAQNKWVEKNRSTHNKYHRKINYLRKYGVSNEEIEELLVFQKGICLCCGSSISLEGRVTAYVDHCHSTGKVRGLICHSCNVALGFVKDSRRTLENMIKYLERAEDVLNG